MAKVKFGKLFGSLGKVEKTVRGRAAATIDATGCFMMMGKINEPSDGGQEWAIRVDVPNVVELFKDALDKPWVDSAPVGVAVPLQYDSGLPIYKVDPITFLKGWSYTQFATDLKDTRPHGHYAYTFGSIEDSPLSKSIAYTDGKRLAFSKSGFPDDAPFMAWPATMIEALVNLTSYSPPLSIGVQRQEGFDLMRLVTASGTITLRVTTGEAGDLRRNMEEMLSSMVASTMRMNLDRTYTVTGSSASLRDLVSQAPTYETNPHDVIAIRLGSQGDVTTLAKGEGEEAVDTDLRCRAGDTLKEYEFTGHIGIRRSYLGEALPFYGPVATLYVTGALEPLRLVCDDGTSIVMPTRTNNEWPDSFSDEVDKLKAKADEIAAQIAREASADF